MKYNLIEERVLKFCRRCDSTWEMTEVIQASSKLNENTEMYKYKYYRNLTPYGKPRAYCPRCAIIAVDEAETEFHHDERIKTQSLPESMIDEYGNYMEDEKWKLIIH